MKTPKTRRAGLPLLALSVCSTFGLSLVNMDAFANGVASIDAGTDADSRRQSALPDIVVTASRIDRDSDAPSVPTGAVVIRGDDIRRSGFSNVAEAIEKLGQVRALTSTAGDGNRVVDLGGYGSTALSNTVVYLDDIRLSQPDMNAPNLHTVPVDLIERIEIIPGGQSVAYGEGATGGVVRIITKRDEKQPLSGSVTAGFGSYSARELRASLNASAGSFGFFVSGAQDEANGFREGTSIQNKNGVMGVNWKEGLYRVSFLTSSEVADSDYPGALSPEEIRRDRRAKGGFFTSSKTDSQTYNLNVVRQQDKRIVAIDVSRKDRGAVLDFGFGMPSNLKSRQDSVVLKFSDRYEVFGRNLNVHAGLEDRDTDYEFFNSIKQNNRALFAAFNYTLSSDWSLSSGVRDEEIHKIKAQGAAMARREHAADVGLTYKASPERSISLRSSRSYRNANADEEPNQFSAPPGAGDFLDTQINHSHEVLWSERYLSALHTARVYRTSSDKEIQYLAQSMPAVNINLDPTRRDGFEYRMEWPVSETFMLKTRVAYVSAKFVEGEFTGRRIPLVPERQASINVSWSPMKQHRVDGYLNANSSAWLGGDFENSLSKLPGYATLDGRYVFEGQGRTLTFALNNIADRRYITQGNFNGFSTGLFPENGRNFRVTLRQSF